MAKRPPKSTTAPGAEAPQDRPQDPPQDPPQDQPQDSPQDLRGAAIDALLELATDRDWNDITLPEIADRAGLSLAELRTLFPSKGAILAAFSRRIDEVVLEGIDPTMATEPARERLFDTLMRRLDALAPHRAAIAGLYRSFSCDPLALASWNRVVVNSMQWMLAAADIGSDGPLGSLRAQGLAIAWSRILPVWLDDEDEGLARTMTEIDRQLRSGERWMRRADELYRMTRPLRRLAERSMRRRSRFRDRVRDGLRDMADGRGRRGSDDEAEAM
jgi:AcrR family transcriptional regulator